MLNAFKYLELDLNQLLLSVCYHIIKSTSNIMLSIVKTK